MDHEHLYEPRQTMGPQHCTFERCREYQIQIAANKWNRSVRKIRLVIVAMKAHTLPFSTPDLTSSKMPAIHISTRCKSSKCQSARPLNSYTYATERGHRPSRLKGYSRMGLPDAFCFERFDRMLDCETCLDGYVQSHFFAVRNSLSSAGKCKPRERGVSVSLCQSGRRN